MIYIFAPAAFASGGPELLHQLGYKLRLMGFDAYIYYYEFGNSKELGIKRHPNYEKYNVPYVSDMIDDEDNIVIVTEGLFQILDNFEYCKKIVWWLSVDFALMNDEKKNFIKDSKDILHLCQSQYAIDYIHNELQVSNDKIAYLSDYINSIFLNLNQDYKREDVVVFNPRKGFENTSELILASTAKIKWQALWGVKPDEMREIMQRAKVYIDFGYHPGKDRIPREAVLAGCRIITNKSGAAKNDVDIMISDNLKFDSIEQPEKILNAIGFLMDHYEDTEIMYADYKKRIQEEFKSFEIDCWKIFGKICKNQYSDYENDKLFDMICDSYIEGNVNQAYRYMLEYRAQGYEENAQFLIMEASIRLAIGELEETIYCANTFLNHDESCYEMWIILAQAYSIRSGNEDINKARECCKRALAYSRGLSDEQEVINLCNEIVNWGL